MQKTLPMTPPMTLIDGSVINAQPNMTAAIRLCQQISGKEDKCFFGPNGIVKDQAQWSRIKNGQHYFPQDSLNKFMDTCGNEAPLLYLVNSRGYDISSLRKQETELERKLREAEEENEKLKLTLRHVLSAGSGK